MTKILLVEDDKSLREIYGVRLLAEGYDIVSAGDGEEALALAIKEHPSLIVSDVMMPKISGFDMLDILRSTTETRDIKVIMMTALSSEDQRLRGQQLGADRYLVKSQVGIEDVVRTVHEVLADAPTSSTDFSSPAPVAPAPQPQPSTPTPGPFANSQIPPAPSRPAAPSVPEREPVSSQMPAPVAPTPQPQPSMPTPGPFAPQEPIAPLPQPTAPFSTPRPVNPSNRVIEPIPGDVSSEAPLADMMAKELNTEASLEAPAQEPQPAPEDHGLAFEETPATVSNNTPPQTPPTA